MRTVQEMFTVPGYEPTSSEFLRKEVSAYYTLRELYNNGELTTWEMNAIDHMVQGFMADLTRDLQLRGLAPGAASMEPDVFALQISLRDQMIKLLEDRAKDQELIEKKQTEIIALQDAQIQDLKTKLALRGAL